MPKTRTKAGFVIPDYCFACGGEIRSLNAWFGPLGTVTPLHHDPHHNILAQVAGKKYIRLYPPSSSEELYPHTETMLYNSSQVDLDNIDEEEFPKILDLGFMDCMLEEGECYISLQSGGTMFILLLRVFQLAFGVASMEILRSDGHYILQSSLIAPLLFISHHFGRIKCVDIFC